MRTLAILFAIVAVSSAATIMTMDDKELEKAMMEHMFSQDSLNPMMDFGALMAAQQHGHQEPEAAEADEEATGERGAREAEEAVDDQKEDAAEEGPQPPYNMFANGMMAMVFPDMPMMGPIPYAASQPAKKPAGGNPEPTNGNGKRGGGSAAAASATSFSRGSNTFSSSQAQAFSGGFNQGS
ncbi:uncharacterized protein [Hetaerina americana]|uniref:uncharacterized protein n=1 Tax=Hetaerina americana TaxID=62018 RepID=UPI003A7F285F